MVPRSREKGAHEKEKFQPTWESRYLIFSNTLTLPKVGLALYHAHQRNASLLVVIYRSLKEWQLVRLVTASLSSLVVAHLRWKTNSPTISLIGGQRRKTMKM